MPVKVVPPRGEGIVQRTELMSALDRARRRRVVWIAAPAGAGKTTLVTSYLAARGLGCVWFQVDEADNDLATFFHHMNMAAHVASGGEAGALPTLQPEYALGVEAFSRSYFRRLFELTLGQVVVLDNFERCGSTSPLHSVIATGLAELPEGASALVLSRSAPPSAFARLRSAGELSELDGRALAFSLEETRALSRVFAERHGQTVSDEDAALLHRQSRGWAAGLVLMLEVSRGEKRSSTDVRWEALEAVFDYFASEVLDQADPETTALWLRTAMLTEVTVDLAKALSGLPDAAVRLRDLGRRGQFTVRHGEDPPTWQYHPLFREFLVRQAPRLLGAEQWLSLQRRAAEALVAADRPEQAMALLHGLGEWAPLAGLLIQHTPALLAQGRHLSVLRWFEGMPKAIVEGEPWLLHALGLARAQLDLPAAREVLELALERFRARGDSLGSFLCWVAIVQTIIFEQRDYRPLGAWLAVGEALLERFELPSPAIEALVHVGLVDCVFGFQPDHPSSDAWVARALDLTHELPDPTVGIQFGWFAHSALSWAGDWRRREVFLDELRLLGDTPMASPLAVTALRTSEAFHHFTNANWELSAQAREAGLTLATQTGVRLLEPLLLGSGAAVALANDELEAAEELLLRLQPLVDPKRRLDYGLYRLLSGWLAMLRGEFALARDHFATSAEMAERLGARWLPASSLGPLAVALQRLGDARGADEALDRAHEWVEGGGLWAEYATWMSEAEVRLERGDRSGARAALSRGLALGHEHSFWNFFACRREALGRLCAEALAVDIEVPFVHGLIRRHRLDAPRAPDLDVEHWPWHLRVVTLGGLEVSCQGERLTFEGKSPRRPLQLLLSVIAFGGREVSEVALCDALWPDADGDAAAQSLATTLHRLRRLVGGCIIRQSRCLSLDPHRCWVDAWRVEELTRVVRADGVTEQALDGALELLLASYRGPFLPQVDDPLIVGYRNRLRRRVVACLLRVGERFQAEASWERAASVYRGALDADPLVEVAYRNLMNALAHLGRVPEALALYDRCREVLDAHLGAVPSPETVAVYDALARRSRP